MGENSGKGLLPIPSHLYAGEPLYCQGGAQPLQEVDPLKLKDDGPPLVKQEVGSPPSLLPPLDLFYPFSALSSSPTFPPVFPSSFTGSTYEPINPYILQETV